MRRYQGEPAGYPDTRANRRDFGYRWNRPDIPIPGRTGGISDTGGTGRISRYQGEPAGLSGIRVLLRGDV